MNTITKSDLKIGDDVIFKWNGYHGDGPNSIWDGHIIQISENSICIFILYGHHSTTEDVVFEDILAVYAKDGEYQKIKNYIGNGYLTLAGQEYLKEVDE